jgi:hypothetical protein
LKNARYVEILVESFVPLSTAGRHGLVHVRPVRGQVFDDALYVECSKELSHEYPVGTKFLIRAKLTDREGGGEFLYSHYRWPFKVLTNREAAEYIARASTARTAKRARTKRSR